MSGRPDDPLLLVTLPLTRWRVLLLQLAEGPFKTVGPLIAEIEQQCNGQIPRNGQDRVAGSAHQEEAHER